MATQNGVIEKSSGDLLRAGMGVDFATDGSFNGATEEIRTDVPVPAPTRPELPQDYDKEFYRYDGNTWNLIRLDQLTTEFNNATIITSDFTAFNETTILADTSGGNVTITLPLVRDAEGRAYYIKKITSDTNKIIIQGTDGEQVEDAATFEIEIHEDSGTFVGKRDYVNEVDQWEIE